MQLESSLELGTHPAAPAAVLGQERQQGKLPWCQRRNAENESQCFWTPHTAGKPDTGAPHPW